MAYLHLFDTKSAHDAVYDGEGYNEPWVGYITADTTVTYNKVAVVDYKNIPGSIIYAEGNGTLKATSKDEWSASLGTPVAVVVIPASHMSDGKCRGVSLCNMSYVTPQTGTLMVGDDDAETYGTDLLLGPFDTDAAGLTNYSQLQGLTQLETKGYIPSDLSKGLTEFKGKTVTTTDSSDGLSAYLDTYDGRDMEMTPRLVSPYNADGTPNTLYRTAGQALADMNGKANTQALVNLSAIKDTYSSGSFANDMDNYPAVFACSLFSTQGTSQGDWYLPALGELGYMWVMEKAINESLAQIGTSHAVQIGNIFNDPYMNSLGSWYWSSSEYSNGSAWCLFSNGDVGINSNGANSGSSRARAFASFDI